MVKRHAEVNLFYIGTEIQRISEIADSIGEYETFKEKYSQLISKKTSNDEWNEYLKKYYHRVLLDAVGYLHNKIDSRKTKGQSFSKINHELDDHQMRLDTNNLTMKDFNLIRTALLRLDKEIYENIEIEKCNKRQFWNGIWLGAFVGLILGLIAGILTHRFGLT